MKWIKVKEKLPGPNDNIIGYTPGYKEDHVLTYRQLLGGSLRYCRHVTHWLALEPPDYVIEDNNCIKRYAE